MGPFLGFIEFIPRLAGNDFFLVLQVVDEDFLEIQDPWMTLDECQLDDSEGFLHLRVLIELIEHDFRNDVTAQFNHDAHTLPVRFIAQVRNAFQGLILHQMSNTLNEAGFIDLIRNLGHDDTVLVFGHRLYMSLGTDLDNPAARRIGLTNTADTKDLGSCWKVRSLDGAHKIFDGCIWMIDKHDQGIHDFPKVVGRNVRCHPNGNTSRTIDQKGWNLRRQDCRLLQRFIIVRDEIDRILFNVAKHLHGNLAHTDFCITHSSRRIPIDGTKVPMSIHHEVAGRKILCKSHDGVINRIIPMGMILTKDVTDNTGRFLVSLVGKHASFIHGI